MYVEKCKYGQEGMSFERRNKESTSQIEEREESQ